jgi:hypothetical protein
MSALRPPMVPVTLRVRAYFAPVDRVSGAPTTFDPSLHGGLFSTGSPPSPWVDAGWIENFTRTAATRIDPVRAGAAGAPVAQVRSQLESRVELDFRDWGKLQMALSGGSQHMNVLAAGSGVAPAPSGATPLPAVALAIGSTASELFLSTGDLQSFSAGDLVAIDADYQDQAGYVGAGIAASYVSDPASVQHDINYIRRVTFNVGRVSAKTANSLLLAQPLLGGAPPAGAGVQKVVAFLDRDGGSFFQQWSALFVTGEDGLGRICYYYPRLESCAPAKETAYDIATGLAAHALHAAFLALPVTDAGDGEPALCFRSFFPDPAAAVY